jgi:DNA-binding transcriptional regulator LsrR (DeoR family)
MGEKQKRAGNGQGPSGKRPRSKGRRKRAADEDALDLQERIALACKYFCEGHPPSKIQKLMMKKHKIEISREKPYKYIAHAAKQGWIQYVAPAEHRLREQLLKDHAWLQGVEVVHTSVFDDVAYHAARMLLELLRTRRRSPYGKKEVHIGFAGGHIMRRVAERFAGLLGQSHDGLPESLVFHALVAGFNVDEPTTAPNAFFTYFVNDPAIQVEIKFVGLHAPPIVESAQFPRLKKLEGIKEPLARLSELDIIVTSAGSWTKTCKHAMLHVYMERSRPSLKKLEDAGYLGDMLWRPIGPDGPIEIETEIRAMTLVELSTLPAFIEKGNAVLLALGPCSACYEPRTEILGTILGLKENLITHLVADSRSVAPLVKRSA